MLVAEGRPGEGGGLHPEEAAPGLPAVLLRPQRPAVPQESSHARTDVRLHSGTGTPPYSKLPDPRGKQRIHMVAYIVSV